MGVHSCTGPMGREELLTVLLGGEVVTRSCINSVKKTNTQLGYSLY